MTGRRATFTSSASAPAEKTRELLLEAAKKIFARHGYDGATVKDICDAAGVNISLVSYHFHGKEGLFRCCLEQFGQSRLQVAQRLLQKPTSIEEFRIRLKMFLEEMLGCFIEEPELSRIIIREIDLGMETASDAFQNTFLKTFETLTSFVTDAHKAGFLRKDVEPRMAASMIFAVISNSARTDQINKKYFKQSISDPAYASRLIEQLSTIFLNGVLAAPYATELPKRPK